MSGDGKTVTKSQIILVGSAIIRLCISIVLTAWLGRILIPEHYGFYTLINIIFMLSYELLNLGTDNIATREIILNPESERQIIETLMGGRFIMGVGIAAFILILAFLQDDSATRFILTAVSVIVCFLYINAQYVPFILRQKQAGPAILSLSTHLFTLVASFPLFFLKTNGLFFAAIIIFREAFNLFGIQLLTIRLLRFRPQMRISLRQFRLFIDKSFAFVASTFIYNLFFFNGIFLLWLMDKKTALGCYSAAFRPILPLLSMPWLVIVPLVPVLTRAAKIDKVIFHKLIHDLLCLATGVGAIAAVCGITLSPDIMFLLYGEKYSHGVLSAIPTFRNFSLALAMGFIIPVLVAGLLAGREENRLILTCCTGLVINLSFNLLLIPRGGVMYMAMLIVLTQVVLCAGITFASGTIRAVLFKNIKPLLFTFPAILIYFFSQAMPASHMVRTGLGIFFSTAGIFWVMNTRTARLHRRDLSSISVDI